MKLKTKHIKPPDNPLSRIDLLRRKLISYYCMGKIKTYTELFDMAGTIDEESFIYLSQLLIDSPREKPTKEKVDMFLKLVEEVESHVVTQEQIDKGLEILNRIESDIQKTDSLKQYQILYSNLNPVPILDSTNKSLARFNPDPKIESNEIPVELVMDIDTKHDIKDVTPATLELMQLQEDRELETSAKQKCTLFKFQSRASLEILDNIRMHHKRGQLLQAGAGIGKTFILGAVIRRILDSKFLDGKTYSPWPIVYITRASVVTQTERVLTKYFGVDCLAGEVTVINIEQLRAKFGQMFIEERTLIKNGETHIEWVWKNNIHPCIFIVDECQIAKNEDSTQAKILTAIANIKSDNIYCIYSSATPFTRICEARSFMLNCRMKIDNHYQLNNHTWPHFSKEIAAPSDPTEHSPSAIDRLVKRYLLPYMVDVKGVHPQFRALNRTTIIDFENDQQRQEYAKAWDEYVAECNKLGKEVTEFAQLALFTILQRKAEVIRAPYFAKKARALVDNGYAVCIGVKNKQTIVKTVKLLIDKYGVSRNQISIIWGGATKTNYKKKVEGIDQETLEALKKAGIDYEAMIKAAEENDLREQEQAGDKYRLGIQSKKVRDAEILRFQSGKSLYCFFTFKAGGVGLSLHHTDEFTKEKVGRKESGFAVEEDIPKIPTRPRYALHAPTYSAIEMVQALGRAPRLTSLSDTIQELVFYRGTIEEDVAAKVSIKLKCLKKVVRQRESWEDVVINRAYGKTMESNLPKQLEADTTNTDEDDSDLIGLETDVDEDEDEESEDSE